MKIHFNASNHDLARIRLQQLVDFYGHNALADATHIVALGGDGHMLNVLHETMTSGLPVFGMNCGHLGFLMNHYASAELPERIAAAETAALHPLRMIATNKDGTTHEALAINEVSLLRQTHNAAHINISVDGKNKLEQLICDGVLLATPVGSTAYNLSAHGPVIPLGTELMALTPISPFRPRRWRGALLPETSAVELVNLEPDFRPLSVSADSTEFRHVKHVSVAQARDITLNLLYDPGFSLTERAIQEQFLV
ncbi:NAD kinase [Candidatus Puniceispirillum sp.]|uniref:NAD kinase n=1 Tax=Candidatus Puniceispirillum sp. TaxID=2026719 RepID=UPI003F695CB6